MIRDEKGFTTLELVIVFLLIIIVSIMFVPSLNYFQGRRVTDTEKEMNKIVSQAVISYYGMTGDYPIDDIYTLGEYKDISKKDSSDILQKIFDVTGYKSLETYSSEKYKMNINVINEYVVKIEVEKR